MSTLHSIEDFSNIIRSRVEPITGCQHVPLHQCLNRVSAEPLFAPFHLPEVATSAMDGYALLAADWQADKPFRVSQKIMADSIAQPHTAGTVARIFTGGRLPEGTDCVIIQENSRRLDNDQVFLHQKAIAGHNVRAAASNFAKGQELFSAGSIINPPRLALAAMVGQAHILVKPSIKVSVLAVGDELIAPGKMLVAGKIYDSNSAMMAHLLQQFGCVVERHTIADDAALIRSTIIAASEQSDLVISCGGASVGERDHIATIIADAGELHAWKVSVKPGKPVVFGSITNAGRRVPFFGLPGNPSSSMVTGVLFVRLAIRQLLAINEAESTPYALPVTNDYSNAGDRHQFVYCRRDHAGVTIDDQQISASLLSASAATGMCCLAPRQTVSAGDLVDYYSFAEMFSLEH